MHVVYVVSWHVCRQYSAISKYILTHEVIHEVMHGGAVIAHWPPACEIRAQILPCLQVRKLVVASRLLTV